MVKKDKMNKRGLSSIVTTLIILVISLVAIGVIYVIFNNLINGNYTITQQVCEEKLTFNSQHLVNIKQNYITHKIMQLNIEAIENPNDIKEVEKKINILMNMSNDIKYTETVCHEESVEEVPEKGCFVEDRYSGDCLSWIDNIPRKKSDISRGWLNENAICSDICIEDSNCYDSILKTQGIVDFKEINTQLRCDKWYYRNYTIESKYKNIDAR